MVCTDHVLLLGQWNQGVRHVARMGDTRHAHRILVEKLLENIQREDREGDYRIVSSHNQLSQNL